MEVEVEFLEVNMCAVCLSEKSDLISVDFDDMLEFTVGTVLVKHLWFQPEELHFKYVCEDCWEQVKQFHDFYMSVEKTHAGMKFSLDSEKQDFSVKTESVAHEEMHVEAEVQSADPDFKHTNSDPVEPASSHTADDPIDPDSTEAVEKEEHLESYLDEDSTSEDSSEDESDAEESPEKSPDTVKKRTKKKNPTSAENLVKMYHKSIEEMEHEDRKISDHCKLNCDDCDTVLPNFVEFKRHFREVHQVKAHVMCCNRKFHKRLRLVEHVTRHMNPNAFTCTICEKSYCNSAGLNLHMIKHGSPETFVHKCDQCDRAFAKKFQLNAHQVQHVSEKDKKCVCPVCEKAFANKYTLQHHIDRVHRKQFQFVCEICSKILYSRQTWNTHRLTHSEILPSEKMQCLQCGSWHKNAHSLIKHEKRHKEIDRKLICPDCGKETPNSNALRSHRTYAHRLKPTHVCEVCGRAFKRAMSLKEHMSQHTGKHLYKCPYCERQFNSSANMFSHRKRAHRIQWEQDLSFANVAQLNVHIKSRHVRVEKLICDVCAKSFKVKAQFDKHRKEHDESYQEVRLQCKICSKWMKNASSLRKHVLRHDGAGGNHECEICGKRAPNILALQSHISFVHKKEKMYQCSLCPKAFKRQFSLMEHMTTHTGEVLYQCPFCVKTFNSSANMHAHKKKVHPREWEESKRKSELPFSGKIKTNMSVCEPAS